jgi:hypothetical protein
MKNRTVHTARAVFAACVACLLTTGCDPLSSPSGPSGSGPGPGPGPGPAPPLAASIDAYNQCYSGCYTSHTTTTNRETCKLDCDGLAEMALGADANPTTRTTYEHLRGCIIGCWENRSLSETNRSTCLLTCTEDAEVEATPAPKQTLEVVPGTVLAPDAKLPPGVRPPSPPAQ